MDGFIQAYNSRIDIEEMTYNHVWQFNVPLINIIDWLQRQGTAKAYTYLAHFHSYRKDDKDKYETYITMALIKDPNYEPALTDWILRHNTLISIVKQEMIELYIDRCERLKKVRPYMYKRNTFLASLYYMIKNYEKCIENTLEEEEEGGRHKLYRPLEFILGSHVTIEMARKYYNNIPLIQKLLSEIDCRPGGMEYEKAKKEFEELAN